MYGIVYTAVLLGVQHFGSDRVSQGTWMCRVVLPPEGTQPVCPGTAQNRSPEQHQWVKPLSVDMHTSYTHAD